MSLIRLPKLETPPSYTLPKLMSRKDVMNHFGISKSTLHRWTNVDDKLKSFQVGRRKFFKMNDVENMIEEHYSLSNN